MSGCPLQGNVDGAIAEIAFAYDHVPFFRSHLERHGLQPGDFATADDLRKLPPTTKADYRKHFPVGILADDASMSDPFVHKSASSGTGGERLVTVAYTFELAERMEGTMSVHPSLLGTLEDVRGQRVCRYAAPNCSDVECATPHTTMKDRILHDGTLVLPVLHDLLATPASMVDQAIEEIDEYRPHWFYADPTHLAFLARQMRRRGLPPPPVQALMLTYTLATRVARRQLRDFWGRGPGMAEVVSMSELGWLVLECPEGRTHINTDQFHIELLDGDEPVGPGTWGELYVTSVGDTLCPHIRYRTGDVYTWDAHACPCGHHFPVVRHEGRWTNMVTRDGDVLLSPRGLDDLVGEPPWLDVYKLHQLDTDHLRLKLIPNEGYEPRAEADLVACLADALGHPPRLEVEVVDYIQGDRSGKFTSCVSEVSQQAFAS